MESTFLVIQIQCKLWEMFLVSVQQTPPQNKTTYGIYLLPELEITNYQLVDTVLIAMSQPASLTLSPKYLVKLFFKFSIIITWPRNCMSHNLSHDVWIYYLND